MKNFKDLKWVKDIEDHYKIGKLIGKGGFGSVNKATPVGIEEEVAIKII